MKKIQIVIVVFLVFFAIGAKAEGLNISPSVIDEKAKAKEILKYTVKLKNEKASMVQLYAVLYDILPNKDREISSPSELDQKTSVTKWTSVKRGVISLQPGEEVEVPLEIDVDLTAIPGTYHSVIAFAEGNNRSVAESNVNSADQILVNIEVGDQTIEKAQIEKFETTKNIFTKYPVSLNLQIKNNGNVAITPKGEIFIYNRRDQQVGEVDLNSLGDQVDKDASKNFQIKWTNEAGGFGKFKAKLEAEYGTKNPRDLQDTIYFWVFPTVYLIFFVIGLFLTTFLLTYLLFKKSQHARQAHRSSDDDNLEEEEEFEDDEDDEDDNNHHGHIINLKKHV